MTSSWNIMNSAVKRKSSLLVKVQRLSYRLILISIWMQLSTDSPAAGYLSIPKYQELYSVEIRRFEANFTLTAKTITSDIKRRKPKDILTISCVKQLFLPRASSLKLPKHRVLIYYQETLSNWTAWYPGLREADF